MGHFLLNLLIFHVLSSAKICNSDLLIEQTNLFHLGYYENRVPFSDVQFKMDSSLHQIS